MPHVYAFVYPTSPILNPPRLCAPPILHIRSFLENITDLYSTLLYSTLLLSDAPTRYSFLSLRSKMTPDEHKCRGERERGRQVTARCNCFLFSFLFYFFLLVFFFVSFSFFSLPCFFRPLAPPLLEVHAIVARKCKMRMACSDAFVGRMMARRDRKQPCWFFASMEHRGTVIVVALLLYCFSDNSDLFILI